MNKNKLQKEDVAEGFFHKPFVEAHGNGKRLVR
jgi:hypothetical protein